MQQGFNQDLIYKGERYHIQTEDGGLKNPVITTILFKEGSIIAVKRTSYADIIKFERLDKVVKEIMSEQHNSLIKALKEGRFEKRSEPTLSQNQGF